MTGHIAFAHGSPCPTLVLDRRLLADDEGEMLTQLAGVRRSLAEAGAAHILKNALIQPSSHPLFDLDYRFVQSLPGAVTRFDLRGSCGHSILSSIVAAANAGMLPRLSTGDRIRVNVLNNGDQVVCEVDETTRDSTRFTAHFLRSPATPVRELLMLGEPVTVVEVDGQPLPVSLVSAGNPYVFVAAASLGIGSRAELLADDPALFARLNGIRTVVCDRLGWDPTGAFPKVAAVLPTGHGEIAVRAVSVPSWHPTLALTGATCLGAAARIPGTIPWAAAAFADCADDLIRIDTMGGGTAVRATLSGDGADRRLEWVSVEHKLVTFHGSFAIEPINHLKFLEAAPCLSSST